MQRVRDFFRPVDRARYLVWRAMRSNQILQVTLQNGQRMAMRQPPATDLLTAYELFLGGAYRPPAEVPNRPARYIVDVGANVGYSVLHWAATYPSARILAFEPHPTHLRLLYQHVDANGLGGRVMVVGSAVSDRNGEGFLLDRENESAVVTDAGSGRLMIQVRDFFAEVGNQPIDILKLDIEGGEYPILEDRRFEALDIRTMVLEWHNTPERPNGRQWCTERLTGLGYQVAPGALEYSGAGILWAWKPSPSAA